MKYIETTTSKRRVCHVCAVVLIMELILTFGIVKGEAKGESTVLVSVNSSGTASGNNSSRASLISGNGRVVIFTSSASDLVANVNDTNNASDVFARDLHTNITTLVSVNNTGTASGNAVSGADAAISSDGRFVVFTSSASDLINVADLNSASDVFVRDLATQTTTPVSVNGAGVASGNGMSLAPAISRDGRFVAFISRAADLTTIPDMNSAADIFVRDLQAGTTTIVSVNATGSASGNAESGSYLCVDCAEISDNPITAPSKPSDLSVLGERDLSFVVAPKLSDDGRFIAFVSRASDLTAGDANKVEDIYVRDRITGTTALASVNRSGVAVGSSPISSSDDDFVVSSFSLSGNGRVVVFESKADDITDDDANNTRDVFARDLQTGVTSLVSISTTGTTSGNRASFLLPVSSRAPVRISGSSISTDGRWVVFASEASDLVSNDTDGDGAPSTDVYARTDVFVHDLQNRRTTLVSLSRTNTGGSSGYAAEAAISRDGRFVVFDSAATNAIFTPPFAGNHNIFVRDLVLNTTRFANISYRGELSNREARNVSLSDNGRVAVFDSTSNNLTANDQSGNNDVFAFINPASKTRRDDRFFNRRRFGVGRGVSK